MNHGSQYPADCCNQTSRSQNLCQAEALSGFPLLITEITLLLLSRLTSAPISRADTSDMPSRSHSGEGGQTARNAAQPRRPRPNISRPMGGLGLVESHICTHIYLNPCISTQYTPQYLTISGNGEISIPITNTQYPIPHNTTGKFHRQTGHHSVQ